MVFVTDGKIGIDLTATPTTPEHPLGTRTVATDGQHFVYVQASGAITQYDVVGVDENFQAAAVTKAIVDDGWEIGTAQVAFADNDYGWIATKGSNLTINVLGSCAADVALYTSATAGSLDDTSASQTKIDGIVLVTANATTAAGSYEALLTFPKSTTF